MQTNKRCTDREEHLIKELQQDSREDAKIYVEVAVEEYETDNDLKFLMFSFERYIKARGLEDLLSVLTELEYDFKLVPLLSANKNDNHPPHSPAVNG